jgi:hypothetical protein
MDFILYSTVLLVVLALTFFAIEKPYIVATILVFCFVYRFNVELPGPLDARAILTLFLFFRLIVFDKQNLILLKKYLFRDFNWSLLILFLLINFYTTFMNYGSLRGLIQGTSLLIISLLLGFIVIINGQGKKVFLYGIGLAGILTTIDILWSTIMFSSLQIRSLFKVVLLRESFTEHTASNHNPMGLICSYALILIFFSWIKKQTPKTISLPLLFFFSLGLLISTSRSSLIAVVIALTILFLVQKEIQFNLNKVLIGFIGTTLFLVSFYFLYNTILSSGQFKSSFIDQTYYRLYEEPMSLIGGNEGKVFNKQGKLKEGNARGRVERSTKDLKKYFRLDLETQLFGIGQGGYRINNFGEDYNVVNPVDAHNGYVLILVERGIIGFLLYIAVIISLSFKSFKLLNNNLIDTPLIYIILVLVFYAVAQNSELTQSLAFLFFGAAIGNTKENLLVQDINKSKKSSAFSKIDHKGDQKEKILVNSQI